jgi:hypothetical protein
MKEERRWHGEEGNGVGEEKGAGRQGPRRRFCQQNFPTFLSPFLLVFLRLWRLYRSVRESLKAKNPEVIWDTFRFLAYVLPLLTMENTSKILDPF